MRHQNTSKVLEEGALSALVRQRLTNVDWRCADKAELNYFLNLKRSGNVSKSRPSLGSLSLAVPFTNLRI